MANGKNQIAKKQNGIPSYLQVKGQELGTEHIDQSDVIIPRIKIAQGLSKAKGTNKELKDGMFYDSITSESFGDKLNFFVLLFWRSRSWFLKTKFIGTTFKNINTNEDVWIGDRAICEANSDFTGEKNKIKEIKIISAYNYMIMPEKTLLKALKINDIPFPYIFACSSSAMKYAKQMNSKFKINAAKSMPIYAQMINASTILQSFEAGDAYMPQFSYGRYPTAAEVKILQALYKECKTLQQRTSTYEEENEEDGKEEHINPVKTEPKQADTSFAFDNSDPI